jgi:hypothetical protein
MPLARRKFGLTKRPAPSRLEDLHIRAEADSLEKQAGTRRRLVAREAATEPKLGDSYTKRRHRLDAQLKKAGDEMEASNTDRMELADRDLDRARVKRRRGPSTPAKSIDDY